MNSPSEDNKNCFCYPDGQLPTVQQLLDTQNNGQERLVIYLYKNSATNEIKMYTPSAKKQALIPDIPYDSGDGLVTVTTENVYTLLYNNPFKIKVFNDHIQTLVPKVTDSLAIGLNTGAIENIYPNSDSYLIPNNDNKGNEYSLAPNVIVANGPSGEFVKEPQKLKKTSTNIPDSAFPEQYDSNNITPGQYWMPSNYPYTQPDTPVAVPLNPQSGPNNTQTFLEDPLALIVDPQYSPYKLQATPLNSPSVLPNPQAFPENTQVYPGNSEFTPDNHQVAPGNAQAFPDSYVGGIDQHAVFTFQSDQGLNKLQPGSQDINNPLSTQYLTFDVWFKQQMKRFQNIHLPNEIKTIDSNVLRILVQKTFYENNIYVSADGVITNGKGVVIDAANLELRPLLLGETFSHQILQNVHKVIKLPKHLPYLEGILVTLVSPPQILGIIPLGKTYLPETSYIAPSLGGLTSVNGSKMYISGIGNYAKGPLNLAYKEIYPGPTKYYAYSSPKRVPLSGNSNSETYSKTLAIAYPYSSGNQKPQLGLNERTNWSSGPYQTVSQLPYPTANWNPSELLQLLGQRRKMTDAKIQHHYETPTKTRKKGTGRIKLIDEKGNVLQEVTTIEPFPSINGTESGRRFPSSSLSGVMKTLLYLLNDLPSRRGLNSTEAVEIVKESESNDGGGPDFRIIGGNAATGSGTPLSNKGRSGYTENV